MGNKGTSTGIFLGAYVTSPSLFEWDEAKELAYFDQIKAIPGLRGLEHPFWGSLHRFDEAWFLENIDPEWEFVFTCLPGTMERLKEDSQFGIASDDHEGRLRGISYMDAARRAVEMLNDHLGREAVLAVHLATAPKLPSDNASSSRRALERSLSEMVAWDWQGASLVIEHCDAHVVGRSPEKGFMGLDDEIAAVQAVTATTGVGIGMTINWGRSAIETRSTDGVITHIEKVKRAGLLSGLMFSGCSNRQSPWGAWKDTHMPPAQALNNEFYAEESLMTADTMRDAMIAADYPHLLYLGAKIMWMPNDVDLRTRVGVNRDTAFLLNELTGQVVR